MENNSLGAIKTHKTVVLSEGKNECGSTVVFFCTLTLNILKMSRVAWDLLGYFHLNIQVYQKLCVESWDVWSYVICLTVGVRYVCSTL